MNASSSDTIKRPCATWANALAAGPDDLSAAERAALDEHVATCEVCAAARADYARMDALILSLPAPAALASFPAQALQYEEEAEVVAHEMDSAGGSAADPRTLPLRPQRRLPSRPAAFGVIAAVLIIGVVVVGFAVLLSPRQSGPGATTRFNGDYGPTVLPTGPQPQVGNWRPISLPSGVPEQQSLYFSVTPQISVPNLVYGCWQPVTDPQTRGPAQMWRSEDEGRTWKMLSTPAGLSPQQAGCYIETSPGAPDTVFLTVPLGGKADIATYYSLDRGDHWQTLPRPTGSELWDVAAPKAEGEAWYYIRTVGVTQPEIWVSRDHGAQWTSHAYPAHFPPARDDGTYPGVGPDLWLRYEKGGLLFIFEGVLWWSPDYGATWQKLGTWSQPPCAGAIFGTSDLSVLYCIEWNGEQAPDPYWRSLDYGQTWKPIPPRSMAPSEASSEGAVIRASPPVVLRDGSLLKIAAIPGSANDSAFYSLAPNTNVWDQASAPLNSILGSCAQLTPGVNTASPLSAVSPFCAQQVPMLANSPTGKQYVYQERATDGRMMVGEITWAPRTP